MGKKTSKILFFFLFSISLASLISFASAADVGYILLNDRSPDPQIMSVFSSMNLSVQLIEDASINSYNLANYKLLFLDDVRLRKTALKPIYNYPSVIMNSFYGKEWGLTDSDGVSKLVSTDPLSVRIVNNGIQQVYTQAFEKSGNTLAIPYFYLDDQNKANFTSVARTYIGDAGDRYDFGDVIAVAQKNTHLINGKYSKNKMCFYGIAKTEYWTPVARQLFIDCVESVMVQCYSNSDCDDKNITTTDSCVNPGTVQSYCSNVPLPKCSNFIDDDSDSLIDSLDPGCHTDGNASNTLSYNSSDNNESNPPIVCNSNSNCGSVSSSLSCSGDNLLNTTITPTCNNAGTTLSYCQNITTNISTLCEYGCNSSILGCNPKPMVHDASLYNSSSDYIAFIKLTQNSSIVLSNPAIILRGQSFIVNFKVKNKGDYNETINATGRIGNYTWQQALFDLNPGETSTDRTKTVNELFPLGFYNVTISANLFGVTDANPLDNQAVRPIRVVECLTNGDCSSLGVLNYYCIGNDVWKNMSSGNCVDYSCSGGLNQAFNNTCDYACAFGNCIRCDTNSDCNDNNSSTQDLCVSPGMLNSSCQNKIICVDKDGDGYNVTGGVCGIVDCNDNNMNVNPGAIEVCNGIDDDCDGSIDEGVCYVRCYNNTDCNDANVKTFDQCILAGTPSSYCRNTEINCFNNEDCGLTGFIGGEYCILDGVFKNFQNSTCVNPGTLLSSCSIQVSQEKLNQCSKACFDGTCIVCDEDSDCVDSNNLTSDFCVNPGTLLSYCDHSINCVDNDKDGYNQSASGCGIPDCNDNNANINPGAIEICNLIDDDCDSLVDEGGVCGECTPGATMQCGLTDVGECEYGIKTCTPERIWGSCIGAVNPTVEICDSKDNDCDSSVDEGLICGNITCDTNADCGTKSNSLICNSNNLINTTITPTCFNGGQVSSYCSNVTLTNTIACSFGCVNGNNYCNNQTIYCGDITATYYNVRKNTGVKPNCPESNWYYYDLNLTEITGLANFTLDRRLRTWLNGDVDGPFYDPISKFGVKTIMPGATVTAYNRWFCSDFHPDTMNERWYGRTLLPQCSEDSTIFSINVA
jgi:hypothetical protein